MLRVAEGLDKRAHISNLSRATTRDYTCPPDRVPLLCPASRPAAQAATPLGGIDTCRNSLPLSNHVMAELKRWESLLPRSIVIKSG
jgi:hypothetical protein